MIIIIMTAPSKILSLLDPAIDLDDGLGAPLYPGIRIKSPLKRIFHKVHLYDNSNEMQSGPNIFSKSVINNVIYSI
jgi:hypothetical protein